MIGLDMLRVHSVASLNVKGRHVHSHHQVQSVVERPPSPDVFARLLDTSTAPKALLGELLFRHVYRTAMHRRAHARRNT